MTPQDESATGPSVEPFAILAPRLFDGERMRDNAVVLVRHGHVAGVLSEAEFAKLDSPTNLRFIDCPKVRFSPPVSSTCRSMAAAG